MSNLSESWRRTAIFLRRAFDAADAPPLPDFEDYLDHNELELAADVLLDFGDEQPDKSESFWTALKYAYENMGFGQQAKLCQFRIYEVANGFVEARLTLASQEQGRSRGISTDYRPDWNIGNRTESGEMEINGAPVTLEDASMIDPGETGVVRLHPLLPEIWQQVVVGQRIDMHEGARVIGHAVVLRVTLRRTE